jgi:hypothetical protein
MKVMQWSAALICGVALALPVAAQTEEVPKEPPPPQEVEAVPAEAEPEPAVEATTKQASYGDPPLHRWGGWTVSVAAWNPDLIGGDEEIAALNQGGFLNPLFLYADPRITETIGVSYHLPRDIGSITAHYDSMSQEDRVTYLSPGRFQLRRDACFFGVPRRLRRCALGRHRRVGVAQIERVPPRIPAKGLRVQVGARDLGCGLSTA